MASDWTRAKSTNRCELCGSHAPGSGDFKSGCEWTKGYRKGTRYYLCRFKSQGAFRTSYSPQFGMKLYHHLVEETTLSSVAISEVPEIEPAGIFACNTAYSELLTGKLSGLHRAYLRARALPPEMVIENRYTTLPRDYVLRNQTANEIAKIADLRGVSGFWWDSRGLWHLEGRPGGLLLPVRNEHGLISGCQINGEPAIEVYLKYRAKALPVPEEEKQKLKGKYFWLSSKPEVRTGKHGGEYISRKTGIQANVSLHYPLQIKTEAERGEDIAVSMQGLLTANRYLLVEGILKSDVVAYLWGGPERVIGLPGGSACHEQAAVLFGAAQSVLLGFDMDWQENQSLRSALEAIIRRIGRNRSLDEVYLLCWPPECGKGLDDVLLGGARSAAKICRMKALEWLSLYGENKAA